MNSKSSALAVAILVGLACNADSARAAQAVTLNPLGVGQVLLFPYYTVNGGNDTYLSVVNTTNRGKAVKVRFLEGRNSKGVLDFNLYLSAFDVWTAALISLDSNGPANLLTRDRSCTAPDLVTNSFLPTLADGTHYVPFRNFEYASLQPDNGGTSLGRTREGHFEMIDMGVLSRGTAATQIEEEISHQSASGGPNSGIPLNCAAVVSNWLSTGTPTGGAWGDLSTGNRQLDIGMPSGGLYGNAVIINVANGTLHAYAADAIEGFYGGTAPPGSLHFAPGDRRPNLADASSGGATIDSEISTENGERIRSTWNVGALPDAVSAVLMQDAIYNEFNSELALAAQSEWVITFPTKRYYVDNSGPAIRPFTRPFRPTGEACEVTAPSFWDREDQKIVYNLECLPCGLNECGFIPPAVPPDCPFRTQMCFAAQVESINQPQVVSAGPTSILGSLNAKNFQVANQSTSIADRGHARIQFDNADVAGRQNSMTSVDGDTYNGLPVIGFWASNYVNSAAQPGKLANYSGAVRHRGSRNIVGS